MLGLLFFIVKLIDYYLVFWIGKLHLQIIPLPSLRGRGRGWGFYPLICPSPSINHLYVVNAWSPIGPRGPSF